MMPRGVEVAFHRAAKAYLEHIREVVGLHVRKAKLRCERCGWESTMLTKRGFCLCGLPPLAVDLTPVERFEVFELLASLNVVVHEWCGKTSCKGCLR